MAAIDEPMTLQDLTEIYRVEKKSGSLMNVRSDLFKALAQLIKNQRIEYDKLLSQDPDSFKCDIANSHRKQGMQLVTDIIEIRMGKICKMALRGAMGANNSLDALTPEEKDYYNKILEISKAQNSIIHRINGSIRYVSPDITEVPEAEPVKKTEPVKPATEEPPSIPSEEEYYEPEDDIPIPAVEEPEQKPAQPEVVEAEVPLDITPEEGEMEFTEEPEGDIPEDELDRIPPTEEKPVTKFKEDPDFMLVRIVKDMGTIATPGGTNLALRKESVVRIQTLFAQALINNGIAEKISASP